MGGIKVVKSALWYTCLPLLFPPCALIAIAILHCLLMPLTQMPTIDFPYHFILGNSTFIVECLSKVSKEVK